MFRWFGQRSEKRKQKTRELSEREISISPMFKWFGQRPKKSKQKTRQLWEREFNTVKDGLDEKQVVAFVDDLIAQRKASQQASAASLRSVLKTAVTDAEQIAASIKLKAQTEAEEEAARTIDQAKQEADEIRRRTEVAAQEESEDILAASNRKAEISEVEMRQKALLFLLRAREKIEKEVVGEYKRAYARLSSSLQDLLSEGQNIATELKDKRARLWESKNFKLKEYEATLLSASGVAVPPPETLAPAETEIEPDIAGKEKTEEPTQLQEEATEEGIEQPVQLEEEALEEKVEEPVQLEKEATVSELVEVITEELLEENLTEERPGDEEPDSAPLKLDSRALYTGEVELAMAIPVDPKTVSKLYNYLQTTPEIKILHVRGSWDRGTTITVALDKPIPLISMISKIPEIEATPELLQKDNSVKGTSSSLLRAKGKGVKRIKLTLKKGQPPVEG